MCRLARLRSLERRLPRTPKRAARQPMPSGAAWRRAPAEWWSDDPHWFPGGTPPRRHNRVTPLVDGQAYFTALHEALAEAQHYVYIAGWCLTPAISLLREAQHLIYLENQYLWSDEIVDALVAAMGSRGEQLRILALLPARAERGKYDNDRQVDRLRKEDHGRGIVSIYTPFAWGPSLGTHPFACRPTYSHAKVGIVDDEWFTVGSANLNERGLARDSEINAVVHDPAVARALRVELWAEHLALPCEQVAEADPIELVDRVWPDRARSNVQLIKDSDKPLVCPAFFYTSGRVPGTWFLEEAEAITFDR
jgi:phosphatidylserine/phosphatidylglycerophosphate/cardiolipin synthase-like enzyme